MEQADPMAGKHQEVVPRPEEPWKAAKPDGKPRCQARSRQQTRAAGYDVQCANYASPGHQVCSHHGAKAPQARRKAALRLLELVNPAIATLAREMAQADTSRDRQAAANSILDRSGVPRTTTTPDGDAARELLLERLRQIRAERGEPDPDHDREREDVECAVDLAQELDRMDGGQS